ncbi:Ankyrin repeat domain-containing protein 34B, partial [Frankliniella fusca]
LYLISESARKLQSAFEGVNLPVVKPKGRPKGSRKTVSYKLKSDNPSKKEKPRGAMSTPFEIAMKGRQMRGSQIKDSDVTENSDGSWTVTSQSDKNVVYTVTTETCTCPDWTQNSPVCKHMFKVRSVVSEAIAFRLPNCLNC